jgi:glucosamine--fructose-6-phosphate aminotransferase (isomerizing)
VDYPAKGILRRLYSGPTYPYKKGVNPTPSGSSLAREMMETPEMISSFEVSKLDRFLDTLPEGDRFLLTGEGSSRIFPTKQAISRSLVLGLPKRFQSEGSHQAREMDLDGWMVFGASNSGRTKELLLLFEEMRRRRIPTVGITAGEGTLLERFADHTFVLSCGTETAIPASKSVIAEALFFDHLVLRAAGRSIESALPELAKAARQVLECRMDPALTRLAANAGTIFFAGRNDGAAEELALKAMEITRKRSVYLEGTLALHGAEEVMRPDDLIVLLDPFEAEEERFERVFLREIGIPVIAIAPRPTPFPTVAIPPSPGIEPYLSLMAGWNLLVGAGTRLGIDLDKPSRARKIGNEADREER